MERFYLNQYVKDEKYFYMADLALRNEECVPSHKHDFYEFFIVLQGQFKENCNGRQILLKRRHLHILHPDDAHNLNTGIINETNILRNIAVSRNIFEKKVNELGLLPESLVGYYTLDENTFISYFKKTEMIYGPYPDGKPYDFLMNNLLEDIIIAAALQHSNEYNIPKWLKSAYQAMEKEENFSVGLPRLIEITGKSQEHLNRAFKQYYRMTPTEYINLIRLQNASHLLQTSQDKIIDIIFRCGYSSISYFNRLFKAHYGMTPRQYREHNNFLFKSI